MALKTHTHLSLDSLFNKEPDIRTPSPVGFIDRGKGETFYLNKESQFRYASVMGLEAAKGIRGNHYHNLKHEYFFVLEGSVIGYFWDPENPDDQRKETFKKGDFFDIKAGLAHGITTPSTATVLELSPQVYDCDDCEYVANPFMPNFIFK